jgi:hypothetical protein
MFDPRCSSLLCVDRSSMHPYGLPVWLLYLGRYGSNKTRSYDKATMVVVEQVPLRHSLPILAIHQQ